MTASEEPTTEGVVRHDALLATINFEGILVVMADRSHQRRMKQLHEDLQRVVDGDNEQEILEPATPMMLSSVRAAYDALPEDHVLRGALGIELITMDQISGNGEPIRMVDLMLIVGQLLASLPNSALVSSASRGR